jgi:two-component system phosphate regulon response regulator PhoB
MSRERILVVDDEKDILELVRYSLDRNGYQIETATSGEEALAKTRRRIPDLIILDLMLPGIDGLEVCRRLKSDGKTERVPIIMLTAKSEEADVVTGLELGAEDYVTKPFSPRVLTARVRRILHRAVSQDLERPPIKIRELTIDPARREVLVGGKPVHLTFTEFNILYAMAKQPGFAYTRYDIIDTVHGGDYLVTERAVDVQIVSLRRKLRDCGKCIETVRGVGYRFRG